jgi:hypothetical protein
MSLEERREVIIEAYCSLSSALDACLSVAPHSICSAAEKVLG